MELNDFPNAVDPEKVGKYPALAKAGGGYVWDEVLEYRVWCQPGRGAPDLEDGSDYYYAFITLADAWEFAKSNPGCDHPIALVMQREYINEPEAGVFEHMKSERIAEWQVEWLKRPRRTDRTIADFLSPDAPTNRLAILRGEAN